MSDYTLKEILKAVEEIDGCWNELEYSDLILRGEKVKCVVLEETGGEGKGEYASIVFQIGDRYFRKEGYYASYDGYTWDGDFDEVEPYQKTITDYRVKNNRK